MPVFTYIALDRKIAGVRERVFLRGEEGWSLKDHPVFAGAVNCHCPILSVSPPPSFKGNHRYFGRLLHP